MKILQNKNLQKLLTALLFFGLAVACFAIGNQNVSAATPPARCNVPAFDKNKVVNCTAAMAKAYPPDTGTFKNGKCYVLTKKANGHGGSSYVWQSTGGCNVAPFKVATKPPTPPSGGAKCNNPFIPPSGHVVPCTTLAKAGVPVNTGTFKNGYCYVITNIGTPAKPKFQWVGSTANCNKPPFKAEEKTTDSHLPDSPGERSCVLGPHDEPGSCRIFARWLFPAIDFLAMGVGIIVTIMIVVGGIQYSAARGDPNAVAAARRRIFNAVYALVAYGFFWSFMQWLIPGGIF